MSSSHGKVSVKTSSMINAGRLEGLNFVASGKVRDIYDIDEKTLLFVTTDRLSAFDVVMKTGVPCKGQILNQITTFWLKWIESEGLCKTHLITDDISQMPEAVQKHADVIKGRAMLVKKLKMLPIEAIVRGYITGSGWKDYGKTGKVCGIDLPTGLQHCQQLEPAIFTPSTKAEMGLHDENISVARMREILKSVDWIKDGDKMADNVIETALAIYTKASEFAKEKGIILADTKMEFGVDEEGNLVLGDEVLTPDSSRYWPGAEYEVGRNQNSYDKQYVRNWLESIKFDKETPMAIPTEVQQNTTVKYKEIFNILTGRDPIV